MKEKFYRKKPIVIRAYKTGKDELIHTLEGNIKVSAGDYIITGVNGEKYPCKPDIFTRACLQTESNAIDEDFFSFGKESRQNSGGKITVRRVVMSL